MKRKILNENKIDIILERLSNEILENHFETKNSVLLGIQPRGIELCKRLYQNLKKLNNCFKMGKLDISFYRDDFRRSDKIITPSDMDLNVSLENKNVILVDDVLYTGRTVRSALEALLSFGRPKKIELLTFIDRRFCRELPIQADYIGIQVDTLENEKVIVTFDQKEKSVYLTN
tara:strand:+ start:2139 stop:2660 length:522 start_codon:yes stop_codon:yes gene_type:complete